MGKVSARLTAPAPSRKELLKIFKFLVLLGRLIPLDAPPAPMLRFAIARRPGDAGGRGGGSGRMRWSCGIAALGWTTVPLPERWGSSAIPGRGGGDSDGGNLRKMPNGFVIKSLKK